MINLFTSVMIPLIVGFIILDGLYNEINVFDVFISGVEENIKVGVKILPSLIGLMVAIGVLKSSGFLSFLTEIISPISGFFHIPADIIPQFLLRPISSSGSLVVFKDIIDKYGPDSFISKMSSILQGSSETTFYVITIYYGAVNINKIKYTLPCALISDFVCLISSIFISSLMFK